MILSRPTKYVVISNYMSRLLILSLCLLSGCAIVAPVFGVGGSTLQILQVVDRGKLLVDAASTAGTGKSTTDHLISKVLDRDCNVTLLITGDGYCSSKNICQ